MWFQGIFLITYEDDGERNDLQSRLPFSFCKTQPEVVSEVGSLPLGTPPLAAWFVYDLLEPKLAYSTHKEIYFGVFFKLSNV